MFVGLVGWGGGSRREKVDARVWGTYVDVRVCVGGSGLAGEPRAGDVIRSHDARLELARIT